MDKYKKTDNSLFQKILVVDIETVPLTPIWEELAPTLQKHWIHKTNFIIPKDDESNDPASIFENRAGIYSEFGKIVCIGLGFVTTNKGEQEIRLKVLKNDDEKVLLLDFIKLVHHFEQSVKDFMFCGHNIKEFDIPYLCRRIIINGLQLPACLDLGGLKPWQVHHQDTLELWRFGDYKHYITLDLLATILQVPSSKSDMDGSQVGMVYWKEHGLDRIAKYCLDDVYTTTLVYLRLKGWTGELPLPVYV